MAGKRKINMSDQKRADLDNRLLTAIQNKDWYEVGILYNKQALLLEKEGGDSIVPRHESLKAFRKVRREELFRYQESSVDKVEILATKGESCSACLALNGKTYSIQQALKENPLPVKSCTSGYGYCRCCYLPVV
jgi:hypothetical protein